MFGTGGMKGRSRPGAAATMWLVADFYLCERKGATVEKLLSSHRESSAWPVGRLGAVRAIGSACAHLCALHPSKEQALNH